MMSILKSILLGKMARGRCCAFSLLLLLLLFPSLWAWSQTGLIRESRPFSAETYGQLRKQNPHIQGLLPHFAQGDIAPGAQLVQLDTAGLLSNAPLLIELEGQTYPVIKTRHLPDQNAPGAYDLFGHLMGDAGYTFHLRRKPNGDHQFSLHTPRGKYYCTPTGDGEQLLYRLNPEVAGDACGSIPKEEKEEAPSIEELTQASAAGKQAAPICELRTLFLYTNEVNIPRSDLESALDANLNYINSDIMQDGNGLNPRLKLQAANKGCLPKITKAGLIKADANAYGSYSEISCLISDNGVKMRDDLEDGLSGTGPASWLKKARKDYAADYVVLITSFTLYSYGKCPNGTNVFGLTTSNPDENEAVIVIRAKGTFIDLALNPDPTNLTLVHEFGHVFGCKHEGNSSIYKGYCHDATEQKTIMHTYGETAPCDGGVEERKPIFSHLVHDFPDGSPAGASNALSAYRVGDQFADHTGYFELVNTGTGNNLDYTGDFANNSGHVRRISTPGLVTLYNASNSGTDFVHVGKASGVLIHGVFSSQRLAIGEQPLLPSGSKVEFDTAEQESALEAVVTEQALQVLDLQAHPNPVEHEVKLNFQLSRDAAVGFELLTLEGKLVKVWESSELLPAGPHAVEWGLSDLAPGLYLCRIHSQGSAKTVKLLKR